MGIWLLPPLGYCECNEYGYVNITFASCFKFFYTRSRIARSYDNSNISFFEDPPLSILAIFYLFIYLIVAILMAHCDLFSISLIICKYALLFLKFKMFCFYN